MSTPRIAAIHDLSCFGRCSLTIALPVLSAMGCQCCPLPTALLSAHTGFPGNISIVAVDHRAVADVVGLSLCAGHRAEVVAVARSVDTAGDTARGAVACDRAKVGAVGCRGRTSDHTADSRADHYAGYLHAAFVPAEVYLTAANSVADHTAGADGII